MLVDNYEWLHGYDVSFGVIDADRKSVRYRSTRDDDAGLREKLRELANHLETVREGERKRIARELYREVATGEQAREIYQIGTQYKSADETLAKLGYSPNRQPGERGGIDDLVEKSR